MLEETAAIRVVHVRSDVERTRARHGDRVDVVVALVLDVVVVGVVVVDDDNAVVDLVDVVDAVAVNDGGHHVGLRRRQLDVLHTIVAVAHLVVISVGLAMRLLLFLVLMIASAIATTSGVVVRVIVLTVIMQLLLLLLKQKLLLLLLLLVMLTMLTVILFELCCVLTRILACRYRAVLVRRALIALAQQNGAKLFVKIVC